MAWGCGEYCDRQGQAVVSLNQSEQNFGARYEERRRADVPA